MSVFEECERCVAEAIRLGQELDKLAGEDDDPAAMRGCSVAMAAMGLALREVAQSFGALYEAKA